MRRLFWVLIGALLARLVAFSAGSVTVTVPGTAGPWSQSLPGNLSFDYGVHDNTGPVVIDAASGIPFTSGAVITVKYSSGLVSGAVNDPTYPVDANGDLSYPAAPGGTSNGRFPSSFTSSPSLGYLAQLVGTFANKSGVIVGTPFIVGDGPLKLTIPVGATQLQLGINDNAYRDNSGSFTVKVSSGCQVNVQPMYSQCSNPWGTSKYDSDAKNRTMCKLGCATTALTMALGAGGVLGLPGPINGFVGLDPGSLNQFMTFHTGDYVGNMVQFEAATLDLGFATTALTGGKTLFFDDSLNGGNNPADLKNAVCDGHAVIVKVSPIAQCAVLFGPPGGHYVVVTGEHEDAGGNPHFDIADPGCAMGFGSLPPIASLDKYNNLFEMRGFVSDPANVSTLEVVTDNGADLLVTDSSGNRTGFDPSSFMIRKEITRSSYSQDFLTDNDTGQQATGITHSINLFEPVPGPYNITITGLQTGAYSLTILPFSVDGTPQTRLAMAGITGNGATTLYQVLYSPTGTSAQLSLSPSSHGTVPPTQVSTTASGLAYSRVSQTFNGTVTIKNISGTAIAGPIQIVFASLTNGVVLADRTGTIAGTPFMTVPGVTSLAPGQSATVSVQFKNSSNAKINFMPVIYSGSLN